MKKKKIKKSIRLALWIPLLLLSAVGCSEDKVETKSNEESTEIEKNEVESPKKQVLRELGSPIRLKSLVVNEKLDWTSGGMPDNMKKTYCEERPNSFYGRYHIIDKQLEINPVVVGYIDIGSTGSMGDWKSTDEQQVIHGIYLESGVLKIWNTLYVGMGRYELIQFLNKRGSELMNVADEKQKSFFMLDNFYGFVEFERNQIHKIELKRDC